MSLITGFKKLVSGKIPRYSRNSPAAMINQRNVPPVLGTADFLLSYESNPGVRAMAGKVAQGIGDTKWKFIRTDTDQEIDKTHLMPRTLRRPNNLMSGNGLIRVTQLCLDLTGDAFWFLERNGLGAPVAYWPIPTHWVADLPVLHRPTYRLSYMSWQAEIPEREMIWFHDASPHNPYGRGHGIIQALADEVTGDEFASKHSAQIFFNRAAPEFVVMDSTARDEELDSFELAWMSRLRGLYRAMKPYFVNRKLDFWQPAQQNLENLTLVPLRVFERDIQLQTWGIPPEQLGITTSCHDEKTECLTRLGWKKHDALSLSDEIATWNENIQRIEYQHPTDVQCFEHDGLMHHWSGRRIDVMVTPEHRLWRMDKRSNWQMQTSLEHSLESGWFHWRATGGGYEGRVQAVVIPPHVTKRPTHRPDDEGPTVFHPEDFAYFLGAFIAEGCIYKGDQGRVEISQNSGEKANKMKSAMEELSLAPVGDRARVLPSGNIGHEFRMSHRGLASWLREEVGTGARNKRLPQDVFEWSLQARLSLLEGLIDGDGSMHDGVCSYASASETLVDDIQRLCIDLGFVCSKNPASRFKQALWTLHFRLEPNRKSGLSSFVTVGNYSSDDSKAVWATKEHYIGIVWCVTVPNGIFFTRRNGRVVAHGNSNRATAETSDYIFESRVLKPRRTFLAEELSLKLAPQYDERIEVQFVDTSPRDKEHALRVMIANPSAFTVDEWRESSGAKALNTDFGRARKVMLSDYYTLDPMDTESRPGQPGMAAVPPGGEEPKSEDEEPKEEKPPKPKPEPAKPNTNQKPKEE